MNTSDRLRLAVFIDFDNIEIGVKNTLHANFDVSLVLDALKERGDVVSKLAYSDWQRVSGYSRMLSQHAIRMVQRNMTPGGDKNGADINLALDALEMAFTHTHINAFVIVAGDSDFISLVEKLKQYDKKVFVVGGRQFTSGILQRNCHEFIAYENLLGSGNAPASSPERGGHRRGRGGESRPSRPGVEQTGIDQAIPLVTRALKVLSERELSPQLGLLKSTLLQLDSTFSERSYGAGSFRDFVQKLTDLGVVKVTPSKGGWLVWPADAAPTTQESEAPAESGEPDAAVPSPVPTGTPADGLRHFRALLASANIRRWPMYLRNVQQLLRQANPPLDVRAYGFGTLVDLLRAAHRDGVVRVDRDRQGVIRVFEMPGVTAPAASPASTEAGPEPASDETAAAENAQTDREPDEAVEHAAPAASAPPDIDAETTPSTEPKKGRRRGGAGRSSRRRPKKNAASG